MRFQGKTEKGGDEDSLNHQSLFLVEEKKGGIGGRGA